MVANRNLLAQQMPRAVAEDLMGAGGSFNCRFGHQIDPERLDGSHVFIVTDGIASKFQRSEIGRVCGVGMVGFEGLFPLSALLQVPAADRIVLAHVGHLSGRVLRTKDFHGIVSQSPEAWALVAKYVYAFTAQVNSNLMATEQDSIPARVARSLLMCHDRVDGDEIAITHDALAQLVFAHRPTITNVLHEMREERIIGMARGLITVRSRQRLWQIAGGSYGASEAYWNDHIGPFGKDGAGPPLSRVA